MIRCPWCGAHNYAIDSWCSRCSRHLDFEPPAPKARPQTAGRRGWSLLAPVAVALGVAMSLAVLVGSWLNSAGQAPPPTAFAPAAPTALATPADSSAPAEPAPTDRPSPVDEQVETGQAMVPTGGDPAAAVARFYQAVSAHDFQAAATLWTSRMQAQYPPAEFIDQRFSGTQQINLDAERMLGDGGGIAIVYVDVVEVIDGQTRHWLGTWQLVDTSSGWLLNRPNLRVAT